MKHFNRVVVALVSVLVGGLICVVGASAQTPSPAAPAPTATVTPTPSPPLQTSVPGHPLQVLFGPQPSGASSLGGPDTEGLPTYSDAVAIRREFGNLVTTAVPGFTPTSLSAAGLANRFTSSSFFVDGAGRTLRMGTWTKVGMFVMVVPANSPVSVITQTTISGFAALTIMPSAAVVGGAAPRTIVLTEGKYIWSMELVGFTDNTVALDLALGIVTRALEPGSPATGNGPSPSPGGSMAPALAGAMALVVGAAMLVGARRRRAAVTASGPRQ